MKFITNILAGLTVPVLLLFSAGAWAQDPIQVVNNMTDEQLVNALVDNGCADISNIRISGSGGAQPKEVIVTLHQARIFLLRTGIILSTGFAMDSPGPNNDILSNGSESWGGDGDLEDVLNIDNTRNATIMEFDFVPATSHISFDYIFASEEYTSWGEQQWCDYSDGFAFLLREAGSTAPYQNLAVIPGTNTPVKVTTVRGQGFCPSANPEYFGSFNGVDSPINYNGQTVVLTAEADVTAGTLYHIKLVIADQGDPLYDAAVFLKGNSFGSSINIGDDRLIAENTAICDGQTFGINAHVNNAISYQWYKDGNPIAGAVNETYIVTSAGNYSVAAGLGTACFTRGEIKVEYYSPILLDPFTWNQCDDDSDGLTAFYFSRVGGELVNNHPGLSATSFHLTTEQAQNNTNPISNTDPTIPFYNTVANQQVFARVTNEYGCIAIVPVTLSVSSIIPATLAPIEVCDDDGDGFYTFNLTQLSNNILATTPTGTSIYFNVSYDDALAYQFPITSASFTNTVAGGQTLYVNLSNAQGCYSIMELQLIVHTFGESFTDEELTLCADTTETLDAGSGFASYSWDTTPVQATRNITVDEPGAYTVTVTNAFGCEGSKTFTLLPSGRATDATFEINDLTGNNNSITVTPVGRGVYEYSLDGATYQDSPVFDKLTAGEYTVYIRDTKGCGPVYSEHVFVLDYPAFFTPNGDGINDIWRISYSYHRPGIFITIFDRYGKIITGFKGNEQGWDGTYNGRPLPSTDYWFLIELENGRQVKGHFAMVR